jgi:hypothetical protein
MKCSFLLSASLVLMAFIMPFSAKGQSDFQPAVITEDTYPSSSQDIPLTPASITAYSYGDLMVAGVSVDLYVYTWDPGSNNYPESGIAIRQYLPGSSVNNSTTPLSEDFNPAGWPVFQAHSSEAVILRSGGLIYVLAVYYHWQTHRFMVDLYRWNGVNLVQQTTLGFPMDITVNGGVPFDWIHLDAHNLNDFIITWGENGHIYTKAGTAASGFSMGNTAELDNGSIGMGASGEPDVALVRSPQGLIAHYVYVSLDAANKLVETALDFNDVFTAPPPSPNPALLPPVLEDVQNTPGYYDVPRIDGPDNFSSDDWSYVTTDHRNGRDWVFSGVMASGALQHFILNDGSLGNPDISVAISGQQENNRAVVAYDDSGENLYYGWYYFSTVNLPPGSIIS